MEPEEARGILIRSILSGDREQASLILSKWAEPRGYRRAISDILEPVLEEIGRRWNAEKISLAAGYLAGKVAEDILMKALQSETSTPESRGSVVIGNVEDDYHSLGRKLLGVFLKTAGWRVIDLGNDILAADFVEAAVRNEARVIGASAMMFSTAENIRKIRREIDDRGLTSHLRLAVGGAVFKIRPDLVGEVGGDGTATNAVDAPALFERLSNPGKIP